VNGAQPAATELHCVCGERRVVPAGLRIVSCIKCGQAMGPPLPVPGPRPAIFLLAVAASSTQLVSGIALGLAITGAARRLDASSDLFAWMVVSVVGIFAGGVAYRGGSVAALMVGAAIDAVIVAVCLAGRARVTELLHVSGVVPYVTKDAKLLALAIAALAGVACVACMVTLPQARRYAAWQRSQMELAFRTQRM
jgi:hypothetical protein